MRPLALGFALVALGHIAYLPGELSPMTASTLFDVVTVALLGWIALVAMQGEALPRGAFATLGAVKGVDFLASLSGGFQSYHWGWLGIAAGAILLAVGVWRDAWTLARVGAGVSAAGAAVYVGFGIAYGPAAFLVGALFVLAGWALVAWRVEASSPETAAVDVTA